MDNVNITSYEIKDYTPKQYIIDSLKGMYPHGHGNFIPLMLELMELHSKKNYAYAHGGKPLGNFDRRSSIAARYNNIDNGGYLDLSDPVVVSVWDMFKQIDAAMWQLSQGYNDDIEGVRSRLRDVVVYGALAILMLDERNGGDGQTQS